MKKERFTTRRQAQRILDGQIEGWGIEMATRRQDDTDGSLHDSHELCVTQGVDGDLYVSVGGSRMLRFRTWCGGGSSLRVHNALKMLAEAIHLDNKDRPQEQRSIENRERWERDTACS